MPACKFKIYFYGGSSLVYAGVYSLSRYGGPEARQTSKPQNRRPLFDVELYLTVHNPLSQRH